MGTTKKGYTDLGYLLNLLTSISIDLKLAESHLISPLLQAPADVVHASVLVLQERSHVQALQLLPKAGSPDEAVFLAIILAFALTIAVTLAVARC